MSAKHVNYAKNRFGLRTRNKLPNSTTISCKTRWKTAKGHSGLVAAYSQIRYASKKRKLEFNLTIDEFKRLSVQDCHFCGRKPHQYKYPHSSNVSEAWMKHGLFIKNGLDRINNNLGYSVSNCFPACSTCNFMRGSLSVAQFKRHIKKLIKNWGWI